ncbi:PAS domain-containing hybrid sensor histidine kinase/response regulator [Desulforegula conservatrix]|uniref:PAS domain-containing hybrid sensor histidine kinase/response regulator n=1 Tax=Desulforegula conservatrix TaxID=153026 RepID=UPI0018DE6E8E|nr:PAS domain S-box protein [Desulforegula conservatrix]
MPLNNKVAVSVRDITDRKTAEATLVDSEAMFRALAETSASMIFILSADRKFLYTNPSFQKISGYSETELLNMQYEEIIHSEQKSKSAHIEEILQCLPKSPYRDIIKFVAKEGSEKWMDISVTYINLDSTPALLGSALDITERKLAEEEIKESEVRFRTVFDFFPYAISLTEIESGRFISANNQFSKMVKIRNDEIIGKTSAELGIYPDDFRNQYLVTKIKEVGFVNNLEIDFRANDGSVFNGSLFSKIIRIKNVEMIISVIKDITDLKTLQRQLQQTQKMEAIGTLAGGIAHDFNNILVPIMAYAEMTMECVDKSSKQYDYLNNILNASYRAKDLVQQILSFSRHNEMVFEPMFIQPIIKETVRFLRASIPSTIEIKANLDKKCGAIIGNPSQIHQIIMNLSTNAKHAMEQKGGSLEISLAEAEIWPNDFNEFTDLYPGRYARLTVSDTGHGMDNYLLDKIFEPYFTTKKDGKGTGMGLSVVHGIVKTYGGSISVSSLPGKGTKFDIYLPLVHKVAEKGASTVIHKKPAGIEHILLVDDESVVVEAEREILEGLGYRVSTMTNSMDAYAFFVDNPDKIDLVITDMTMPKMTGAELAMKILDKKPDTPIILCTGYSENFTESNAAAIGIKKYIVKPFVMQNLACSVREALDG